MRQGGDALNKEEVYDKPKSAWKTIDHLDLTKQDLELS